MYQLAHIVNTVLNRARNEGIDMTPMKLQKMIYFLYGEYYKNTGAALFAERFEAWQYGPVVSDVYNAFNNYGARPIKQYMVDVKGAYKMIALDTDPQLFASLLSVFQKYGSMSGIALSKLTHRKGTAWYKAWMNHADFLKDDDIGADFRQ